MKDLVFRFWMKTKKRGDEIIMIDEDSCSSLVEDYCVDETLYTEEGKALHVLFKVHLTVPKKVHLICYTDGSFDMYGRCKVQCKRFEEDEASMELFPVDKTELEVADLLLRRYQKMFASGNRNEKG